MIVGDEQEALMVRYLLGLATEEERTQVEERYFSESEYFDQMLALEDSLIDDFVTGRMPAEQQSAFSESFRFRADDIRFARALCQAVTKKKLDAEPKPRPRPRVTAPRFRLLPSLRPSVPAVAFVALVFVALSIVLLLKNQSLQNRLSQGERRLSELKGEADAAQQELSQARSQRESLAEDLEEERNKRIDAESLVQSQGQSGSAAATPDFKTIVLTAAVVSRGATGAATEVRTSKDVRWYRFHMSVKAYDEYESYRILINSSERPDVFGKPSLKRSGASLKVVVPAEVLTPDDYILTLYGEVTGAPPVELGRYSFRIKEASDR